MREICHRRVLKEDNATNMAAWRKKISGDPRRRDKPGMKKEAVHLLSLKQSF